MNVNTFSLKKRRWFQCIEVQIGLSLLVIITGILALFGVVQYQETRSNSLRELDELARTLQERLGEYLILPVWNMNFALIEKILLSEMSEKRVYGLLVREVANDTVLSGKIRDEDWNAGDFTGEETIPKDMVIRHHELLQEGEKIGSVDVYLSTQFMRDQLHRDIRKNIYAIVVLDAALLFFLSLTLRRLLIRPITELVRIGRKISSGDFEQRISIQRYNEIGDLANVYRDMIEATHQATHLVEEISQGNLAVTVHKRSERDRLMQALDTMVSSLQQVTSLAEEMSHGNLTLEVSPRSERDRLMHALKLMVTKLNDIVRDVKSTAEHVFTGSQDMRKIAEQVAKGNSQQAAAADEASSSMEQMVSNIRQTAENAKMTEQIAIQSAQDAKLGGSAVMKTIEAMKKIEERISIIQEISMQTNILSMNATIEAAKAQDYGKGFAVVASEVRSLAGRSREAAEEIQQLVNSCVMISEQAGEILERLVPNSEKTAELVQEINAAGSEQHTGAEQVNIAIQQLDQVIQQNAFTAEQMAISAEKFSAQVDTLKEAMAFFTVKEHQELQLEEEPEMMQALRTLLLRAKEIDEQMLSSMLDSLSLPHSQEATRPLSENTSEDRESYIGEDDAVQASLHLEKSLWPDRENQGPQKRPEPDELDDHFERF